MLKVAGKLRNGHAPGHLREAFVVVVEAMLEGGDENEPIFWDPRTQARWESMPLHKKARWISGRLWHCTDIMPWQLCDTLGLRHGSTYARGARLIREMLRVDPRLEDPQLALAVVGPAE